MRRAVFLVCLVLGSWRIADRQSGAPMLANAVALVSPKPEFRDQLSRLIPAEVAALSKTLVPVMHPAVRVQSVPALISSHPFADVQSVAALVAHPVVAAPRVPRPVSNPVVAVRKKTALVGPSHESGWTTPARLARTVAAASKPAPPMTCPAVTGPATVAPVVIASPQPVRLPVMQDPAGPAEDVGVIIAGLGPGAVAPAAVLARSSASQELRDQIIFHKLAPVEAVSSPTAPPPVAKAPGDPLKVSYVGGQLRIDALDSTMSDILVKVAAVTGVKIEIPAGATRDVLPVVRLGPGPARQVLAGLLYGSNFDYVILASATDPDGIENVLLMPREKRAGGADAAPGQPRSPFAKAAVLPAGPEETPEPNNAVAAPPDTSAAPSAPPPPAQPDASPSTISPMSPAALSNRSGLTTEGTQNPPSKLDSQSINQQLQQMYQQRMQLIQQGRPLPAPPPPPAPTNQ